MVSSGTKTITLIVQWHIYEINESNSFIVVATVRPSLGKMFAKAGPKKQDFLTETKAAREQRAQLKSKEQGTIKIQVYHL